ncbi:MAG: ArnT family glycosyltransferase [Chloroflexia bacterium]
MLGAAARFWNLNWDGGAFTFNPDEATLNTFAIRLGPDLNPHFFYYGSVPIYLYRATAEVLSTLTGIDWLSTERFALVGRAYSALASAATLLVVFLVGRRLWGRHAGLLAAGFLAASALAIQQAHFGTVDSALTLAGALLLLSALNIAETGRTRHYLISGLILGLALAVKLSAASFIILPLVAHLSRSRPRVDTNRRLFSELVPPALLLVVAAVGCLLAAPYYLLDWPELWDAIMVQSNEFSGGYKLSYTWQFIGRTPYIFEWGNLLLWGLGLPLGLAALGGTAWALRRAVLRRTASLLLLTAWPNLYLLYVGTWEVRFVRYMLPLLPFYCLCAAGALLALRDRLQRAGPAGAWMGRIVIIAVVIGAVGCGLAILSIYTRPDTRNAATNWLYASVPRRSRLLMEASYQHLPITAPEHSADWFRHRLLHVVAPTRTKRAIGSQPISPGANGSRYRIGVGPASCPACPTTCSRAATTPYCSVDASATLKRLSSPIHPGSAPSPGRTMLPRRPSRSSTTPLFIFSATLRGCRRRGCLRC